MNDVHARPVEPCPFYGTPCEYVAVANASAERIKALEVALRDALPRLENCVKDHVWHTQRPPVPHYIVNIRALLKEAGQ